MTGWGFSGSYTSCYISFFFFFSKGNHYKLLHYCLLSKRFSPPAWHPIPLLCSLFCLNLPVNMLKPFFFCLFLSISLSFHFFPLPLPLINAVNNILPSHQRPKLREYLLFYLSFITLFCCWPFSLFHFSFFWKLRAFEVFFFINGRLRKIYWTVLSCWGPLSPFKS